MKKLITVMLASTLFASGMASAGSYYSHDVEPKVGVEVQMIATQKSSPFDYRSLMGVTIPAVGVEVHMGDLITAEAAAAAYDHEGVPATWRAINPATGVEKHLMQ